MKFDYREKLYNAKWKSIIWFLQIGGLLSTVGFMVFCIYLPFVQILNWLKTETMPERDLYWFAADPSCERTDYKAMGFEGMDICRESYIQFCEWAGVNKILNIIFDVHIGIVYLFVLGWLYLIIDRYLSSHEKAVAH